MGWLKQILEENREAVESWPAWKRRMGMLNDSFEARELQKCWTEIERLAKENTQLKADRDELRKTLGSRYAHAESLMVENGQLKADYLAFVEKHQREINGWAESLQQRERVVETLKAELAEMKHAVQMHADLLNVNEEHLQKLLIQSDRELQQTQQREERLREIVRDAIGTVSDLICDWPKDLAAPEIDKIAKWKHALEEQP